MVLGVWIEPDRAKCGVYDSDNRNRGAILRIEPRIMHDVFYGVNGEPYVGIDLANKVVYWINYSPQTISSEERIRLEESTLHVLLNNGHLLI